MYGSDKVSGCNIHTLDLLRDQEGYQSAESEQAYQQARQDLRDTVVRAEAYLNTLTTPINSMEILHRAEQVLRNTDKYVYPAPPKPSVWSRAGHSLKGACAYVSSTWNNWRNPR